MSLEKRGGREISLLRDCNEDILLPLFSSVKSVLYFSIITKNIFLIYHPTIHTIF